VLGRFKKFFYPIFPSFFSSPSPSEEKDSNGNTPIFSAIKSGNLDEVRKIIQKNRLALEQTDENGYTPIFSAIFANKPEIVSMIIEKDPSVLKKTDPSQNTPIFIAIIRESQEIVRMIIKKDPSVLKQKHRLSGSPISFALEFEKPKIAEMILEENPWVLKQMNSIDIKMLLYPAISNGNPRIVKMIIKENPSALKQTDGDVPHYFAAFISCNSSDDDKAAKSEVLQTILEHQFPGNIKENTQKNLEELILKEMLLKGLYSKEDAHSTTNAFKNTFNKITPENTFNKITPENTFKKIYQDLFKNVDKNQPINLKNDEKMYIFSSNLKGHESFFIFHVNEDKNLTSISYCDGNEIDAERKIKDSATHIKGVTTFKLKTSIGYDNDFAKNFIKENTKDKSPEAFYDKFRQKEIIFQGNRIEFSEITHSIPTKAQKRGNCVFKSPSLVARYILEAIDPTMKFGFDMASKKPTGNGYGEYKEFKDDLAKKTMESIIEIKKDISSKSDPLSEDLKKYIEDIMKMVETHSKAKLSKDGQSREGFHEKMNHLSFQAQVGLRSKDKTPKQPSCFSFVTRYFSSNSSNNTPRQP